MDNKTHYAIRNTPFHVSGGNWRLIYETRAEAAEALQQAMAWDSIVLSAPYDMGLDGAQQGWTAYETQAEHDADVNGGDPLSPWIETVKNY